MAVVTSAKTGCPHLTKLILTLSRSRDRPELGFHTCRLSTPVENRKTRLHYAIDAKRNLRRQLHRSQVSYWAAHSHTCTNCKKKTCLAVILLNAGSDMTKRGIAKCNMCIAPDPTTRTDTPCDKNQQQSLKMCLRCFLTNSEFTK